jgi:hypothetical protein
MPAIVECLERFGLTGGLAKPNALLEQIWNTLLRSALAVSYFGKLPSEERWSSSAARSGPERVARTNLEYIVSYSANCHLRNFPVRIDADNPSNPT